MQLNLIGVRDKRLNIDAAPTHQAIGFRVWPRQYMRLDILLLIGRQKPFGMPLALIAQALNAALIIAVYPISQYLAIWTCNGFVPVW